MSVPVRAAAVRDRGAKNSVRPRVRGSAPATTGETRTPAKSSAAQRAYAKRNQRAAIGAATPEVRRGSFTARIPFVATIIGLLSVGLAVTLLLTTRAAEDSYKLSAAKAHNQELIEQKAALERDSRAANSAPELARKAAALGMIPAKDVARLVVADNGAVTVVGTPAPAQGTPVVVPPAATPPATANAATASSATAGTRGSGTAPVNLPPVGSRAATQQAPVAPAPAPAAAGAPAVVAAPAPAVPAATPGTANQPQTSAQDGPLVSMDAGEQVGNQGGTR